MWSGPFCSAILQCLSLSLSDDSNHSYASRAPFTYLSGVRRPAKRGMRSQALLIHVIVIFFSCVSCTWWQPANSAAPGRVRGAWIFQFICTAPVCNSLWSRDAWCRSSNVDEDVYGRKKNHCCCIVRSLSFVVFYTLLRVYCHHYFLLPRVSVNLN